MKTRLNTLAIAASLGLMAAAPAFADEVTEKHVQENASAAMAKLNDPDLGPAERRAEFKELMNQFTDIDLIAMRVLGKYYQQFSDAEKAAFTEAFREYALATYEAELDKYRGNDINVVSSQDSEADNTTKVDSVVTSVIDLPDPQKDLTVLWRVVEFQPQSKYTEVFGPGFKVTDVALDLDGGRIWLAQQQREQFLSILDKNGGKADALIAKVKEMTARLNTEAEQRREALNSAAQSSGSITRAG